MHQEMAGLALNPSGRRRAGMQLPVSSLLPMGAPQFLLPEVGSLPLQWECGTSLGVISESRQPRDGKRVCKCSGCRFPGTWEWPSGGEERGQSRNCSKSPASRARPFPPSVAQATEAQEVTRTVMRGLRVAGVGLGEVDGVRGFSLPARHPNRPWLVTVSDSPALSSSFVCDQETGH